MNLADLTEQPKDLGESVLVYGASKSGKTELVGQLANDFNLLWFDLENGIKTLINTPNLSLEAKKRIEVIQIPDTKVNPVAVETMLKVFTGQKASICHKHGKVGCLSCKAASAPFVDVCLNEIKRDTIVVVDSLSQLSDSAFNTVAGPNVDPTLEWKHYDAWNQRVAMCLSMIQQARYHVVFIGHPRMTELTDGTEKICPVAGTKNFSSNVAKYFGHVLYTETKAGDFKVGSEQKFAVNVQIGNRAHLKINADGVKLRDFFLPPNDVKKLQEVQGVRKPLTFTAQK